MTINSDKAAAEALAATASALQTQIATYAQTNCITQADLVAGVIDADDAASTQVNFIVRFKGIQYPMTDPDVLAQFTGFMAGMNPDLFPTLRDLSCDSGDLTACQDGTNACTMDVADALLVPAPANCPVTGTDLTSDGTECAIGQNAAILFIDLSDLS